MKINTSPTALKLLSKPENMKQFFDQIDNDQIIINDEGNETVFERIGSISINANK